MHILAGGLTSSLDHDPDCKLVRRAVEKLSACFQSIHGCLTEHCKEVRASVPLKLSCHVWH